jgi:NitT/TauT family transport system substrate-binding protein
MAVDVQSTRRTLLAGALGSLLLGRGGAAAETRPLQFQLSWVRSIQYGGYFAASDRGLFQQAGLDVTLAPGGPNIDAIANVASGHAQLGDRPPGPLLIAREKGIPIRVIGTVFQKSPFSIMSLASKPIRTLQDLQGKTVAVGSTARPSMLLLFRQHGIDSDSVTMVPAAPDPFALVSGQLDAYTGLSTNQGVMLEARGIPIVTVNLYDLGLPETSGVIYGMEDFLSANRPQVVAFLRAAIAGWTWAMAHPEETARLTVDHFGSAGLEYAPQLAELKASVPYITAGIAATQGLLAVDVAAYARMIELYHQTGVLKSAMRAEDLCDPTFVEQAHQS